MKFDLPKENSSIIKVLGVGGGGSNAVNHMYRQGINGVDFLVCNTDQQALDISPVPVKVQLGPTLTEGRGAGSIPDVGKSCAMENIDEIRAIISNNTKMLFITAGMGGGTGTGAAPVIAQTAREMGVLTVGIVTMPFFFEGRKRRQQAEQGIEEIRQQVDTLLIINNEKLREMCGNLPIAQAFAMADNVLTTAARGIAEIITRTGYINVDFEDVRTVMRDSGVAIMGSASASGENRAIKAVEKALSSPLLNDNNIQGARYVLLNITFGNEEVLMDEISDITDYIQEEAGASADVIWGYGADESMGDELSVTIIATGFNQNPNTGINQERNVERRKMNLEEQETPAPKAEVKPTVENEPFLRQTEQDQAQELPIEKPKQRVFEFEMNSASRIAPANEQSEQVEDKKAEEPFLKTDLIEPKEEVVQATKESEVKEWEPFIKNESTPEVKAANAAEPSRSQSQPSMERREDADDRSSKEDQNKRAGDRLMRLRELSMKLRNPSGLAALENEPAFKRKAINLDDIPHSGESASSRFTLGEEEGADGEKRTKLRPNNPFLHDNVD